MQKNFKFFYVVCLFFMPQKYFLQLNRVLSEADRWQFTLMRSRLQCWRYLCYPIHPHSACFLHQQRHHLHLHPEMLIALFQRESSITSPRLRRPPSWGRWRRWMTTGRSWRSPSWHRPSTTTRTTTASRRARSCARWSSPRSPASSDRLSKHPPPPIIIITITTCVYLTRW